jgi:hypothetical protein
MEFNLAVIVSLGDEREKVRSPSLAALTGLVAEDIKAVNALIVERMHSPVALIPQLAGHIIAAGGKRLRPMLTLASARLCGYRGHRHISRLRRVHPYGDPAARRRGRRERPAPRARHRQRGVG